MASRSAWNLDPLMPANWNVYRFDYARYMALRPLLSVAESVDAFADVEADARMEVILDALAGGELTPLEARHATLEALCCLGTPLPLDRSFARLISAAGRREAAEPAAEAIGKLLAGGKNLEPWLLPSSGFAGLLTPEETLALHRDFAAVLKRGGAGGRRTRSGGLLGGLRSFFRYLLDRNPRPEDVLRLFGELVALAAKRGEGVALVAA